jgi:hypothetical protein
MAFTFSGAAGRFNDKRALIAVEANSIETAYLRLHSLSPQAQPEFQALFRRYVDSRLETYRKLPDIDAPKLEMATSEKTQRDTWTRAVAASQLADSHRDAGKPPRPGLIRPQAFDQFLVDVRDNMK